MVRKENLGAPGIECFRQELARFPGIRHHLVERITAPHAFTFFPEPLQINRPEELSDKGSLFWGRGLTLGESEKRHLRACYEFMISVLSDDPSRCLLVQSDHFRLVRYRGADGTLIAGERERLMVFPLDTPFDAGDEKYQEEVWVRLQEAAYSEEEIIMTFNRGILVPRPLGVVTTLPVTLSDGKASAEAALKVVENAKMLIYDAFDGEWPIFLSFDSEIVCR